MSVDPEVFVSAMTRHWTTTLKNVPSPELQALWRQMGDTFNARIAGFGSPEGDRWKVIQAPTGTGKSEGLAVYCSLLPDAADHPGVLIVVRLKSQADDIAARINALTGRQAALAYHGDNRVPVETLAHHPVLVITHRAYEIGLDAVNRGQEAVSNWSHLHRWGLEGRKLIVIDEALDIIQESQIDLEKVKVVRALIPEDVAARYPTQMEAIALVEDVLSQMARLARERKANGYKAEHERVLWKGTLPMPETFDMTPLRQELRSLRLDRKLLRKSDPTQNKHLVRHYDEILRDIQATLSNWNWYAKKLADHTINTARLIVPDDIVGPVILDATAQSDVLYQLFEKVDVLPIPTEKNPRSYGNATLRYSRGHAVGKTSLVPNAKEEATRLVGNLQAMFTQERRVLVICHQGVEHHLIGYRESAGFAAFDVAHWGAIDGRNDWADFDVVVVFGLPYRDKAWSANTFMALQGLQSTEWLNADDRPWNQYQDVRRALEIGKLIASTVQGINRIRCRRVIDGEGNCAPVDVVLLLPGDQTGTEILNGIMKQMPGLRPIEWEYEHTRRKPRKSNHEEALVRFAKQMMPGRCSAGEVRQELGISPTQWERLVVAMKRPDSTLTHALGEAGVTYSVEGAGRGARSYLGKESPRV